MVALLIKSLYLPVINTPVVGAAPIGDNLAGCPPTGLHLLPTVILKKAKETRMQTLGNKKTLLFSLLLLATGSAWTGWEEVATTASGTFYVDRATLRKDGNLSKIWEITDNKQRTKNGSISSRMRNEYDCKNERYRFLALSTHPEPMAGGKPIFSDGEDQMWTAIPPGSVSEMVMKIVCAQ
jgi:hypothetical protein